MNDFLTLVFFGLTIVCTLISCGAAVISSIRASKPASVELQSTVDELVSLVEKMMKEQRKVKMSNVRNASKDTEGAAGDFGGAVGRVSSSGQQMLTKADLRALARQKVGS